MMAVSVDQSISVSKAVQQCSGETGTEEDNISETPLSIAKDEEVSESSQEQSHVDNLGDFLNVESTESKLDEGVADSNTLMIEQQKCHNLMPCWQQAKQNKNKFFIENNL